MLSTGCAKSPLAQRDAYKEINIQFLKKTVNERVEQLCKLYARLQKLFFKTGLKMVDKKMSFTNFMRFKHYLRVHKRIFDGLRQVIA